MDEKGLIRYTRAHLRELGIIGYFRELGIKEDELSFVNEFTIRVGRAPILVGENINASHQRILTGDILVSLNGKPLAVIEIKAPTRSLADGSEQAISYARLLPEAAPYAIVTNGKDFLVYDTFTKDLLKTSTDSSWFRYGKKSPPIAEKAKFEASRTFINAIGQESSPNTKREPFEMPQILSNSRNYLNQQHQERLNQAHMSFIVALAILLLGTLLIFIGVICIYIINLPSGTVTAACGIIADIISALVFRFYREANDRLDIVAKEINDLDKFSTAMHYIHYIDDWVTRDRAISDLTNSFTSSSDQGDKKNI